MPRSDRYRLRHLLDKELKANTKWDSLYELVWNFRQQNPMSWNAIAYLVLVLTEIEVSGETLRRWSTDDKGRLVGKEVFYGQAISSV